MLRLILENKNDTGKVNCLISDLREVIKVTLAYFGIDYSWISKSTFKGVWGVCLLGLLLGLSASVVGDFKWEVPMVTPDWKVAAVGGFSAGVVAGLVHERHSGNSGSSENGDLSSRRIDMYYFQGDADGGLEVSVFTQDQ